MAITAAEYGVFFSRVFEEKFRQRNVLAGLASRRDEEELRRNGIVKIPIDRSSPTIVDFDSDTPTNWSAPADSASITYADWTLDRYREINASVTEKGQRNLRPDEVAQQAIEIGVSASNEVETYIWGKLQAATPAAGQNKEFGSATQYIPGEGDLVGSDADKLVYDAIDWISEVAADAKWTGDGSTDPTRRVAILLSGRLRTMLRRYLVRASLSELLTIDLVVGAGLAPTTGYLGTLFGQFDLYQTSAGAIYERGDTSKTKDYHDIFAVLPRVSYRYGEMPPQVDYWSPFPRNPFGPYHRFTGRLDYGAIVPQGIALIKAQIREEA